MIRWDRGLDDRLYDSCSRFGTRRNEFRGRGRRLPTLVGRLLEQEKAKEEWVDLCVCDRRWYTDNVDSQLNLLKRLLSLTGAKFSSSSSARSAGERPILIDREIRVMAMVSLLAVFVDIVP